jgi:hypothetical protein
MATSNYSNLKRLGIPPPIHSLHLSPSRKREYQHRENIKIEIYTCLEMERMEDEDPNSI